METIKPIETEYNGYRFRSRLEARWAVFFDNLHIPYIYEPQGFEFIDGTRYLPDFYLPDCKQFFEVKGVLDEHDKHKIECLIDSGYSVTIGYDNGYFDSCKMVNDNPIKFEFEEKGYSILCKCAECGKYWFMGAHGDGRCQCCGKKDEYNKHIYIMASILDPAFWDIARKARFENISPLNERIRTMLMGVG